MLNYNEMIQTKNNLQALQSDISAKVAHISQSDKLIKACNIINTLLERELTVLELESKEE